MKKIGCAVFFVLLAAPSAWAEWREVFLDEFKQFGVDRAVEKALDKDVHPKDILQLVKERLEESDDTSETLNTKITLKALYCAGQERAVVREAAADVGIPEDEQNGAFEESVAECGSKLALGDRDVLDKSSQGSVADTTVVSVQEEPGVPDVSPPPVDARRFLGRTPTRTVPASPASPSQL